MFYPFDRTRSYQLDAICWLLDHEPHLFVRLALRFYKRWLESAVR